MIILFSILKSTKLSSSCLLYTSIDFVDESGDSYEEFIVFHHKFADWMKANGYDTTKRYTDEEIDELVAQMCIRDR